MSLCQSLLKVSKNFQITSSHLWQQNLFFSLSLMLSRFILTSEINDGIRRRDQCFFSRKRHVIDGLTVDSNLTLKMLLLRKTSKDEPSSSYGKGKIWRRECFVKSSLFLAWMNLHRFDVETFFSSFVSPPASHLFSHGDLMKSER